MESIWFHVFDFVHFTNVADSIKCISSILSTLPTSQDYFRCQCREMDLLNNSWVAGTSITPKLPAWPRRERRPGVWSFGVPPLLWMLSYSSSICFRAWLYVTLLTYIALIWPYLASGIPINDNFSNLQITSPSFFISKYYNIFTVFVLFFKNEIFSVSAVRIYAFQSSFFFKAVLRTHCSIVFVVSIVRTVIQ